MTFMDRLTGVFLALLLASPVNAELAIGSCACLSKLSRDLSAAYQQETHGRVVELTLGSVKQIAKDAGSEEPFSILLTDLQTIYDLLDKIPFGEITCLGGASLVFIWRRGLDINGRSDLSKIRRLAYQNPNFGIYGRASQRFLNENHLNSHFKGPKLKLGSIVEILDDIEKGKIDGALIGTTTSIPNIGALGGMEVMDDQTPPLEIVLAVNKRQSANPDVKKFLDFVKTPKAQSILARNGVKINDEYGTDALARWKIFPKNS